VRANIRWTRNSREIVFKDPLGDFNGYVNGRFEDLALMRIDWAKRPRLRILEK